MTRTPKVAEGPDDGQTVTVSAEIKLKGVAAIDWLAELDGVDRAEEVRRLLAEAVLARKRLIAARELGNQRRTMTGTLTSEKPLRATETAENRPTHT